MQKELKDKWLAALRSGEYKQGTGRLRDKNDNRCCLGVLCEFVPTKSVLINNRYHYDFFIEGNDLTDRSGGVPETLVDCNSAHELICMNDQQNKTFPEIADWIEENIPSE